MLRYVMVCSVLVTATFAASGYLHAEQLQASLGHHPSATDFVGRARCAEAAVHVTGASATERRLACSAASEALQLLGQCQISLRRPLHIEISKEVRQPLRDPIFGLFDTKQEKVLVTRYANIPSLVGGTPYSKLPQEEFYKSLIVHEVVHAVMHQNLKRPATSLAAYEYPAYALQIESLSPRARHEFLQSFDPIVIGADSIFSNSLLHFDPFFFAARAYAHFKASDSGCAHLHGLLEGEVAFIPTLSQSP
jgi:hypothetical protein